MNKLILVVVALISSLNTSEVLAQLSLSCPTQGSLTLINQYTLTTAQPAQCSFSVDNSVFSASVNVTLSEPTLVQSGTTGNKPDPSGTNRTAQLNYNNNGNKTINQNATVTDTFPGSSTTPMFINLQVERPKEFFSGYYIYEVLINITAN